MGLLVGDDLQVLVGMHVVDWGRTGGERWHSGNFYQSLSTIVNAVAPNAPNVALAGPIAPDFLK
jgi:hypothetical protein